jgi:DNA-binding transcriptional LysR family regulator
MSVDRLPSPTVLHERLLARLRLRHLKLVDALATHSHLRRAAEAIHVSQPAATQMLRELETLLGMPLFERHARGMRITEAGRLLALHARAMIDALRVATEALAALATQQTRALRIGAIEAAVASVLQPALPALHAQHPGLRMVIEESNIERLTAGLRGGAFDLVLLRRPPLLEAGHRFVPLRSDRMVVIAGAAHPAAQRKRLRLRDLAASRWVLPPPHYAVRQALDAAWAREKIVPREHAIQALAPHLLLQILSRPDVVVPVPRTALDRLDRAAVVELKLDMHAPIDPLGMLYRIDSAEGPLALLIDFLAAQASGTEKPPK